MHTALRPMLIRRVLPVLLAAGVATGFVWYYWIQPARWRKDAMRAARAQRLDEAVATYDRILRRRPTDSDSRLRYAQLLDITGKTDGAIEHIARLPARIRNQEDVLINLGRMLSDLNRFGEAETHLRRCVELYPNSVRPKQLLLDLYRWQNRHEESAVLHQRLFELADKMTPSDRLWIMFRAFVDEYSKVEDQENWEKLVRWWELDKQAPAPRIAMARLLILQGDRVEEAAADLEKLASVSPASVPLISSLVEYYLNIEGRSVDRAAELIADWPAAFRGNSYWRYRGQLLELEQDVAASEAAYRKALELRPDDLSALQRLSALLVRTGRAAGDSDRVAEGNALAESLARATQGRSSSTRLLDRALEWLKNWDAASQGRATPPDPSILLEFVEFYTQLNRTDEAQRWRAMHELMSSPPRNRARSS